MARHRRHMEWEDLSSGKVAAMVANAHRDSTKKPKPFTAQDFRFLKQEVDEDDKVAAMERKLLAWTRSAGGTVIGDTSYIEDRED